MCLWLITACLGMLPACPNCPAPPNVIVVPTPILTPTTAAPVMTARPGNPTVPPVPPPNPTVAPVPSSNPTVAPVPTVPPVPPPSPTVPPVPPPTVTAAPTTLPPNTSPNTPSTTAAPATTRPPPATTAPPAPTNPPPPMTPASTNPPLTTGGVYLTVLICDNPTIVCLANPNQPVTGPMIDPRLGSTPPAAPSALPIMAYNAQPSYDTAVRFPREKRSLRKSMNFTKGIFDSRHSIRKRQTACTCVAAGTCPTATPNLGAGLIDFRIVTPDSPCPQGQVLCCTAPAPPSPIACGIRQTVPATSVAPAAGQARFGNYPWMALILTNQNDYIAGGVLIDQYNVLTVIHRLTPYLVSGTAPNVKVRLGEWDASGTYEPIPFKEFTIRRVFTHPNFNAATLQYDIAVLRLSTPVTFTPAAGSVPSINRACLPPSSAAVYTGQRCWVTGWGKNAFATGTYQNILKEVEVPVVDSFACQTQLRTARLGATYVFDTATFLCAGGEANRDSCTGDGGSGLVCQANGAWVVVGLVTWGLGCASASVPGVYVSVPALLPWIQQQVATP